MFQLGRVAATAEALARAPSVASHRLAAMPAPPRLRRDTVPFTPGLYDNDTLPDCTAAGLANVARAFGTLNGAEPVVDPDSVPRFYAACAGVNDTYEDMAASGGAVMLDVLRRQLTAGFDVGQQTPLVADFVTLDIGNRQQLATAMVRLGALYCGCELAVADQAGIGKVWDTGTPASAGDPQPGSWGGHCLIAWAYSGLEDSDYVVLGTWGAWQAATWAWLQSRLAEAHGLAWRQLMPAGGPAWYGLDYDRLRADGEAWAAQQS